MKKDTKILKLRSTLELDKEQTMEKPLGWDYPDISLKFLLEEIINFPDKGIQKGGILERFVPDFIETEAKKEVSLFLAAIILAGKIWWEKYGN